MLAAGVEIDTAAVKGHARDRYTKHKDNIFERFAWLKDPTNNIPRALDSGDVGDVSDAMSSSKDLHAVQWPCCRAQDFLSHMHYCGGPQHS